MILLALALSIAANPHPSGAKAPTSLSRREREAAKPKGEGDAIDSVARRYGLAGEVLVARGDRILLERGYGTIRPDGGARHKAGERWRLASITKQVTAAIIVANSRSALDIPLGAGLLPELGKVSLRQLLTHHSGLANPDDTPEIAGVPAFYTKNPPDLSYCTARAGAPGGPFRYNNCDYLIAGAALSAAPDYPTGVWPKGMAMARPDEIGVPGFVGGKPEPEFQLATWGAAGGLMGSARAVFDFDRSLTTGKRLPPAALDELWKPEGGGSYQALGQWVFPGTLKGCTAPKRIVQRDGEIWGVQVRNFILPDDDLIVIAFTNRSADDFAFGEVWQGEGFAYDLLSAAACA